MTWAAQDVNMCFCGNTPWATMSPAGGALIVR